MTRISRQGVLSPTSLWRVAVLFGVTVGLVGIGWVAVRVRPELILIAVLVPLLGLLALSRLEYGVVGILITAAFVRFTLPTGTQSRIVASLLVTVLFVGVWVASMLVAGKRQYLRRSTVNVPLLGFVLATIVSYGWSNAFRDLLVAVWKTWPFVQLGGLAMMILLPGAFLFTANVLTKERWLKILCGLMISVAGIALGGDLLGIDLSFINVGGLFSLCFVSLAYAQALFNRKLPLWLRLALLGLTGGWLYIYFVRRITWLSGWLPALFAVAVITLLRSKRLFLILVLLGVLYVGLNWNYYWGTVVAAEKVESGSSRLEAWAQNWRVTGKHLLFGTGPAGYAVYYMSYYPGEAMATHSNYVDLLSQTGIVGLFFCLWFFAALGWTGLKLCRRLRGAGDFAHGFAVASLGLCIGCVVAMGLGDWMFPFVYTQTIEGFDYAVYSWVLLGGMVALESIRQQRDEVV
jgi:hypothetical protein